MRTIILFIVGLVMSNLGICQNDNPRGLGTWNILNIHYKLNSHWDVFGEGQVRSLRFYDNFHYYEVKGGFNYYLDKKFILTSGFGSYNTYTEGGNFTLPYQQKEWRSWVQVVMKQDLKRLSFEHRYRAEQRFTNNGYRNRFRYRLQASYLIAENPDLYRKWKLVAWTELFFTNKEPYFERNRAHLGVNYKHSKLLTLAAGYTYQFDYKINDETGRDFFHIACLLTFERKKKE